MCIIHKNLVEPFDSLTIYEYNSNLKKKKKKTNQKCSSKIYLLHQKVTNSENSLIPFCRLSLPNS